MSVAPPPKATGAENRIILRDVPWSTYLALRDSPENEHVRMSYDQGVLELMSPSALHEIYARLLDRFVHEVTTESAKPLVCLGATTWRWEPDERGLEADNCYYIDNASAVESKTEIKLQVDPPPDLAIEVDLSSSSISKLPIYESLQIPEVWRFDGESMQFLHLSDRGYIDSTTSRALPWLASDQLVQLLAEHPGANMTNWGLKVRRWMQETVLPSLDNLNH